MAQNYASKDLAVIDERFYTEALTQPIVNNGIKMTFEGVNSVTIYNVDVVPEVDYVRNGQNRFGALVELGTGVQTFVLSQDKAFTFSVDRGNLEDSMLVQEADRAVKRQVREVSIPTTDIYCLSIAAAYALANNQGVKDGTVPTNKTAYQLILAEQAALDDAEVPTEGRYIYMTSTFYNLLKRDPEFVRDCDTSVKDLKKGILGEVDGLTIVKNNIQDEIFHFSI